MAQTKLTDTSPKEDKKVEKIVANELAKAQREISVGEFFAKNRHLLGFDNKKKALLTVVKEAVDNSLDACEEARMLPEIIVEVIDMGNERHRVVVEDNGPGIVKKQVPRIFGKLLYGSKFHRVRQGRGQQGIGISAAVMYGQMTTGRPAKILTKIHPSKPAYACELKLDTQRNEPEVEKEEEREWNKEHGTRVEIDIEATYLKGAQSVDEYLKQTAITNPHATIIYTNPKAEQIIFPRVVNELPRIPEEIQPHLYGVELGRMLEMLAHTQARSLQAFLTTEFTRVGSGTAKQICENAALLPGMKPEEVTRELAEKLMEGVKKTRLISPPATCISPIGAEQLENGLRKEVAAEFYCSTSRPPAIYRGYPFVIEAALAYGGQQSAEEPARVLRYANRVPLLYQQSACASFKAITQTSWRNYGLSQPQSSLPVGPITVVVHVASVWVPFTSESKEAIAHYPEIIKEMKLALQECGRKLGLYVHKKQRIKEAHERANIFERYIPEVAESLAYLSGDKKGRIQEALMKMLDKPEIQAQVALPEEEESIYKLTETKEEEEHE